MRAWVAPVTAFLVALIVLTAGAWWYGETQVFRRVQCDASLPVWMLEAQGYDGGGCAELLPSHEAPADADWTLYCMGMCDGPVEPWPVPSP